MKKNVESDTTLHKHVCNKTKNMYTNMNKTNKCAHACKRVHAQTSLEKTNHKVA